MDQHQNSLTFETRFDLAIKAFEHTAQYDSMIANYFGQLVKPYHIAEGRRGECECGQSQRTFKLTSCVNKLCVTAKTPIKMRHFMLI